LIAGLAALPITFLAIDPLKSTMKADRDPGACLAC